MIDDWREIPCASVDWHCLPSINRRPAHLLARQCTEGTEWLKQHRAEEMERRWHSMTLGELADRGEKWWRRQGCNVGKACVDAIKIMIDHAAAGYEVRKNRDATNAYVPREIPPPPPHLARGQADRRPA